MGRKWVVNSSPLIILGKIGQIKLLEDLSDKLVIPEGVLEEINQGPASDKARRWLNGGQGEQYIQKIEHFSPKVIAWDLGLGETEVISWTEQNTDYTAIIDDRAARNCCKALNTEVIGSLGMILIAKKDGIIKEIKPLLNQIIAQNFRISSKIKALILELAQEK